MPEKELNRTGHRLAAVHTEATPKQLRLELLARYLPADQQLLPLSSQRLLRPAEKPASQESLLTALGLLQESRGLPRDREDSNYLL